MTEKNIKTASLTELRAMKERGEISAPEKNATQLDLPDNFWDNAKVSEPKKKHSVHLRIDDDVFEFFRNQGKGHISRMQAVLRSYVDACTPK
ncbi:MAG: BrnA antitoxin family protein [Roseibium sp.]|uniref:BrnA antitoxin family protein n=1 Tax=Parasphingorhabdus sp. TaxID=2709688 RepID=UPI003298325D